MHPALAIPDVLREIFVTQMAPPIPTEKSSPHMFLSRCLTLYRPERDDLRATRRDLLSAALTCRTFMTHALDGLWRYMDSILPLLSCLYAFQFSEELQKYTISGDVNPDDWTTLDKYASRIRWMNYEHDTPTIHKSVFDYLDRYRGSSILPNLRIFKVLYGHNQSDIVPLWLFVAPTLDIFDIAVIQPKTSAALEAIARCLENIVVHAPNLTQLRVSAHLDEPCLKCIRSLQNLYLLDFEEDDSNFGIERTVRTKDNVLSILGMKNLVTLHLDTHGDSFVIDQSITRELTSLGAVELWGPMHAVVSVLHTFPKHHIYAVKLLIDSQGDSSDNAVASDHIALFNELKFPQLEALRIDSYAGQKSDAPVRTRDILLPLLGCNKLLSLHVNLESTRVNTDDEDIRLMAEAWPRIRELDYVQFEDIEHTHACLPTVFSLEYFAVHCPSLHKLGIILNADIEYPQRPPVSCHGLRHIELYETHVTPESQGNDKAQLACVKKLARVLDCLFPRLEIRKASETGEPWDLMFEHINELQTARRDQDRRIALMNNYLDDDGQ